jgi:copper(I)-binding protein
MKTTKNSFAAMVCLLLLGTGPLAARDYKHGNLEIASPWSRATPGGAKVAAGFMKITNTGKETERLLAAKASIAGVVEVHEMTMVDGVMKMRALGNGIEIAPGQTVELKPGGYHVMFIDLKAPVVKDQPFKAKLVFQKAGEIEVEFAVAPVGAKQKQQGGHHKH